MECSSSRTTNVKRRQDEDGEVRLILITDIYIKTPTAAYAELFINVELSGASVAAQTRLQMKTQMELKLPF